TAWMPPGGDVDSDFAAEHSVVGCEVGAELLETSSVPRFEHAALLSLERQICLTDATLPRTLGQQRRQAECATMNSRKANPVRWIDPPSRVDRTARRFHAQGVTNPPHGRRRLSNRLLEQEHQDPFAPERFLPRPDVLQIAPILELPLENRSRRRRYPALNFRLVSVDQGSHVVVEREPLMDRSPIVFRVVEGRVNLLCRVSERKHDQGRLVERLQSTPR